MAKYMGIFMADEWTAENGYNTQGCVVETFKFDNREDADFESNQNFREWLCSQDGLDLVSRSVEDLRRIVASQSMTDTSYSWYVVKAGRKLDSYEAEYTVWASECAAAVLAMREEAES